MFTLFIQFCSNIVHKYLIPVCKWYSFKMKKNKNKIISNRFKKIERKRIVEINKKIAQYKLKQLSIRSTLRSNGVKNNQ